MKTKKKKPFLSGVPSWGLAGLTVVATIILMMTLLFLGESLKMDERIGEPFFYIVSGGFIAVCCFFIVRRFPGSIWYVPIICNVIGIVSALIERNFWISSLWMFICGGWVLSVIASILGYVAGRRRSDPLSL